MAFNGHGVESDLKNDNSPRHNLRETWDIEDECFSYSPRKPCGNPWEEVLRPLMEKDHIQCSAWKEEVKNLLIFAGLFSAVVTAFIIESYKLLQPAPLLSDQLTAVLLQVSLAQTVTNSTSSPTPSAIRVNILWFTSLMLSLATVLIGIISLQWLQEYQSYPNVSAREKLALFNMRSEAFDKWHIKGIFTTLPLLLQLALVLFFGGIIDFLSQLRPEVAIPVTIIIAITLFFLAATTILPTLQTVALYFGLRNHLRNCSTYSQCPYKSPQSHAFRSICNSVLFGFTCIRWMFKRILSSTPFLPQSQTFIVPIGKEHLPSLFSAFNATSWMHFDLAWLSIRDACSRASFDLLPSLNKSRVILNSDISLYDTSRALLKAIGDTSHSARRSEVWFPAIYYCHQNLANSFLKHYAFVWASNSAGAFNDIQRCYSYLSSLMDIEDPGYNLMVQYGGPRDIGTIRDIAKSIKLTMYTRNLLGFLHMTRGYSTTNDLLRKHILEVKIRLMKAFYGPRHDYYIRPIHISFLLPPSLKLHHREMRELRGQEEYIEFYWQYHHVLLDYFKAIARSMQSDFLPKSLHNHSDITNFLDEAAQHTYTVCSSDSVIFIPSKERRTELWIAFGRILDYISQTLQFDLDAIMVPYKENNTDLKTDSEVSNEQEQSSRIKPSSVHLFFASAIYVQHLLTNCPHGRERTFGIKENLYNLMHTMREYKEMLVATGLPLNPILEEIFHTHPNEHGVARFSMASWPFLDNIPESRSNAPSHFQGIAQNSIQQAIPSHDTIEPRSSVVKEPEDLAETLSSRSKFSTEQRTEDHAILDNLDPNRRNLESQIPSQNDSGTS